MGNRDADALTPREREVLDLVRLGLTNEEIAERLGITLDGAKYHVSQILSKLGVATREEAADTAAAARPPVRAPVRRRWWAALPLAAKAAGAAVVVAGLAVLAWGVLRTEDESAQEAGLDGVSCELTVEGVSKCASLALHRPNEVLHSTGDTTVGAGDASSYSSRDEWIDATRKRARFNSTIGQEFQSLYVIVDDIKYEVRTEGQDPPTFSRNEVTCAPWAALVCPPTNSRDVSATVESGTFEGKPVIILTQRAARGGEYEDSALVIRSYIDATSYLRIADEIVDTVDLGQGPEQTRLLARFQNEFVEAGSLPDGFFDPASIGYVEPLATP